jgi:hypothetical protein
MTDPSVRDALQELVRLYDPDEPGYQDSQGYWERVDAAWDNARASLSKQEAATPAIRSDEQMIRDLAGLTAWLDGLGGSIHTYSLRGIALAAWEAALKAAQPVPLELERLRAALVYVAHAGHSTPLHMLPTGVTLIDGDAVEVRLDGWSVYAGPSAATPAPQEPAEPPELDRTRDGGGNGVRVGPRTLTDEQIMEISWPIFRDSTGYANAEDIIAFARAIESAITKSVADAPDLLAFAQWLLDAYHADSGMPEAKEIAREARAVIAKAESAKALPESSGAVGCGLSPSA